MKHDALSDVFHVNATYASARLAKSLLRSLKEAGYSIDTLRPSDLISFDELHVMGRQATIELGRMAGLSPVMHILDMGSGLGGPARTLAAEFGCQVTGVDLSEEFVAAADELSRRTGLSSLVQYRQADALNLPFADNCFDAVLMFHLNMNILNKIALFYEIRRVLKPGGRMALWEICRGDRPGVVYPVPWATDESFSFLVTPSEFIELIHAGGFRDLQIEDATDHAVQWVRQRMANAQKKPHHKPRMDLDLVMPDFRLRRSNINKNLVSGCVRILRGLATKVPVNG